MINHRHVSPVVVVVVVASPSEYNVELYISKEEEEEKHLPI